MFYSYNDSRLDNEDILAVLVNEGYKDLGWANGGADFSNANTPKRTLDCSLYRFRATNYVYIDDLNKEILHVDMSD